MDYDQFPTPCYIIDEEFLRNNLRVIDRVKKEAGVEIILALKSFAMWRSFPIFREYTDYCTASSYYEARLAVEEFGSKAFTYAPAYDSLDYIGIRQLSSHITFNSFNQFNDFSEIEVYGIKLDPASYGIRINPEYSEVETELYNPCEPGSRFGVSLDQLPEKLPELLDGFHFHCHCESSAEEFQRTLIHIEKTFSPWFSQLKWINFGGGHLMTREDYDVNLLISILKDFKKKYPHLQVILEPGSAFTWQTGVLTSEVLDIVENKGIKTAILNVSFTCHMPDCLEMPYQPTVEGALMGNDGGEYVYRLGGNSCLSGDYVGDYSFSHELQQGDKIIFKDMIHYTTVKTNMFNGVSHPAIGIWTTNGEAKVFRRFTYEDYRDRMC